MIPVQSQSGLHDFSLIETPGSDTDISCYEESESPLGEEKGKRSEYEGNTAMEIIYSGLRSIEGGSEKKTVLRRSHYPSRRTDGQRVEGKKEEVEEKEKVHLLGDNLGASLSRLSSASVSAT